MDNQRIFLWVALALAIWVNWQAWHDDRRPAAAPGGSQNPSVTESAPDLPQPANGGEIDAPALPGTDDVPSAAALEMEASLAGDTFSVRTDVLDAEIALDGGDLVKVILPDYPVRKDQPDIKVQLLDPSASREFVFRTGLQAGQGQPRVTAETRFSAPAERFTLAEGSDMLEVPLTWTSPEGLEVRKTYTFRRGSYAVGVRYDVVNRSAEPWRGASYVQIRKRNTPRERSMTDVDTYSFVGPVIYDGESYDKLKVKDLAKEPLQATYTGGWVAAIQHHFLAAAIPGSTQASYSGAVRNNVFSLSAIGDPVDVASGGTGMFEDTLFVGPKLQDQLKATAPGLRLTVDYGWLTIISQPLFWVLSKIHALVGNWGWAIILLTILIKLAFYKLQETSGRSMAKMRKLQPRLKALQERYGEDRQKLSQAMMELYRKEKVNPASGCLPILVQMPVFLALYWVLLESVELRQAPWALWIDDLSARDPYFILPLLMGVTMFVQQKLNPAPPDPIQAKVMMVLPVVFTVFFAFFPAGLVLYWFVNNLLSIAQQWHINRVVERDG
jgi:YidC/Oxa1 family membrane protein insertase